MKRSRAVCAGALAAVVLAGCGGPPTAVRVATVPPPEPLAETTRLPRRDILSKPPAPPDRPTPPAALSDPNSPLLNARGSCNEPVPGRKGLPEFDFFKPDAKAFSRGELPDIDCWLQQYPKIADAIQWQMPYSGKMLPWSSWDDSQKEDLRLRFKAVWEWYNAGLAGYTYNANDPPPNTASAKLGADDWVADALPHSSAWQLYLFYVANSLVLETGSWLPWSIHDYDAQTLKTFFWSPSFFAWSQQFAGYQLDFNASGVVVPAPALTTVQFLVKKGLVAADPPTTTNRVLDWSRHNLWHFLGDYDVKNMLATWQYKGFAPVSSTLAGTTSALAVDDGPRHWTAGCHGTTGLVRALLRSLNIPVSVAHSGGHAMPYFPTLHKYLSHGDDPYNFWSVNTPFPVESLYLDEATWQQWFGGNSDFHIGRRPTDLALDYLPMRMLKMYCSDLAKKLSHIGGSVYSMLKSDPFTLDYLENTSQLWTRLDAKVAKWGGCNVINQW